MSMPCSFAHTGASSACQAGGRARMSACRNTPHTLFVAVEDILSVVSSFVCAVICGIIILTLGESVLLSSVVAVVLGASVAVAAPCIQTVKRSRPCGIVQR